MFCQFKENESIAGKTQLWLLHHHGAVSLEQPRPGLDQIVAPIGECNKTSKMRRRMLDQVLAVNVEDFKQDAKTEIWNCETHKWARDHWKWNPFPNFWRPYQIFYEKNWTETFQFWFCQWRFPLQEFMPLYSTITCMLGGYMNEKGYTRLKYHSNRSCNGVAITTIL